MSCFVPGTLIESRLPLHPDLPASAFEVQDCIPSRDFLMSFNIVGNILLIVFTNHLTIVDYTKAFEKPLFIDPGHERVLRRRQLLVPGAEQSSFML